MKCVNEMCEQNAHAVHCTRAMLPNKTVQLLHMFLYTLIHIGRSGVNHSQTCNSKPQVAKSRVIPPNQDTILPEDQV